MFQVDQNNQRYWRYVYDKATDTWKLVEFVDGPLQSGGPVSPY
ncbi:MAG TPA: hypothetical protein VMT90_09490 [Dehalococcoidia bacterium]|nr:hypothetical protein [Dehalococcoidia bacterium]